ncbi:hypothetical protein C8R44DRAFT_729177 [Mycena epipterygia]|nr:hypothetical protein C8R44DRAFT_729177 [Mycena epipterygia]
MSSIPPTPIINKSDDLFNDTPRFAGIRRALGYLCVSSADERAARLDAIQYALTGWCCGRPGPEGHATCGLVRRYLAAPGPLTYFQQGRRPAWTRSARAGGVSDGGWIQQVISKRHGENQGSEGGSSWIMKARRRSQNETCDTTNPISRPCIRKNTYREWIERGAEHLGREQDESGTGREGRRLKMRRHRCRPYREWTGEAPQEIETQRKGEAGTSRD